MMETYDTIYNMLDECIACGELTSYEKICIVRMCQQVAAALAANYEKTLKGARDIMGGKILDYDAKDILRQGIEQGICEGERMALTKGIMDILGEHYSVPGYIRNRISAENNVDKLRSWLKIAARTDSIENFESRM